MLILHNFPSLYFFHLIISTKNPWSCQHTSIIPQKSLLNKHWSAVKNGSEIIPDAHTSNVNIELKNILEMFLFCLLLLHTHTHDDDNDDDDEEKKPSRNCEKYFYFMFNIIIMIMVKGGAVAQVNSHTHTHSRTRRAWERAGMQRLSEWAREEKNELVPWSLRLAEKREKKNALIPAAATTPHTHLTHIDSAFSLRTALVAGTKTLPQQQKCASKCKNAERCNSFFSLANICTKTLTKCLSSPH